MQLDCWIWPPGQQQGPGLEGLHDLAPETPGGCLVHKNRDKQEAMGRSLPTSSAAVRQELGHSQQGTRETVLFPHLSLALRNEMAEIT